MKADLNDHLDEGSFVPALWPDVLDEWVLLASVALRIDVTATTDEIQKQ